METAEPDVVGRVIRPTSQDQLGVTYTVSVQIAPPDAVGGTVDGILGHDAGDEVVELALTFLEA